MEVRTVTVELLRAGPPHNQLLSPLTQYLGVCGESGAGVVTLPYEHHTFLRRLRELRYEAGTEEDTARRLEILRDTGAELTRVLETVPGLAGTLRCNREGAEPLIHLRLVLSASELALLPIELCQVPEGSLAPSNNWLALQALMPVCITRHIRSVPTEGVRWPRRPRILFVAGETSNLPFAEHKEALLQAIAPWQHSGHSSADDYGGRLTIIEDATYMSIREAFSSGGYTHVHVLAHGAQDATSEVSSFGLLLRGEDGETDVVSGERFASALNSFGCEQSQQPAVVTVASCDSGNVGSVVTPGSSFAHALHQAGVPLVVASQFPLSKEGSVELARILYQGFMWGENPCVLLYQARTELHGRHTREAHDWASLVAYEALPADLAEQLEEVRYRQIRAALDAALDHFDSAVTKNGASLNESRCRELVAHIDKARRRLPTGGPYTMEGLGLSASSRKRQAEGMYRLAIAEASDEGRSASHTRRCLELLEDAYEDYRQAVIGFMLNVGQPMRREASLHWVMVQMLSLATVLGRTDLDASWWMTAQLAGEIYLDHPAVEERVWAHGSLAELWLLKLGASELTTQERAAAARRACEHAASIVKLTPRRGAFPVESTRRQFRRYLSWWGHAEFARRLLVIDVNLGFDWSGEDGVLETAKRVVAILERRSP
jgi:hypothetical protein